MIKIFKDMKKWKTIIQFIITVLTAIISSFFVQLLKTDDIHPPKSVISVHFFCLTCLMALQI